MAERIEETGPRPDTDPLLGLVINQKYKIVQGIAIGGMGTIYRGEQLVLTRPVAIKVLNPSYTANLRDPAFQKRFFLEAKLLSRLQHNNIVTVFDYGKIEGFRDDRYFMAMEFLPGETLHRRLRARGRLPVHEAIAVTRQIARGLREAHKQGVVHRDMKPSNVMLVPDEDGTENVKILDFGLGKVLSDDSEELTQQGSFLGSPRYMSPEQIAHGKIDARADIYSLGVIFFQMLCGRVPFESEQSVQILIAHLQAPVPRMKDRNPDADVPEVLENLVRRCLEKTPDLRPNNMDDFLKQLREAAVSLGLPGGGHTGHGTMDSIQILAANLGVRASEVPVPVAPDAERARRPSVSVGIVDLPQDALESAAPEVDMGGEEVDIDVEDSSAPAEAAPPSLPRLPSSTDAARAQTSAAQNSLSPAERVPAHSLSPGEDRARIYVPVAIAALFVLLFVVMWQTDPVGSRMSTQPQGEAPSEPASTEVQSFMMIIESTPSGANVYERDVLVGTTPMQVIVSNDSVRAGPRRWSLRHDGYEPVDIEQGQSREGVRRTVNLVTLTPPVAPSVATPAEPTVAPSRFDDRNNNNDDDRVRGPRVGRLPVVRNPRTPAVGLGTTPLDIPRER